MQFIYQSTPIIFIAIMSMTIGVAIGYCIRNVYTFQNRSELIVRNAIKKYFGPPNYHLLNHITLKHGSGTTQIDHILVSRFGVFVIETKNYKGWIFANPKHDAWTQVLFRANFKFRNPINQNLRHVSAVKELLDFLPEHAIKSAVVFTGAAEFKSDLPSGVFTLPKLLAYLEGSTEELLSLNRVQFSVGRLETARLEVTQKTDVEHVRALHVRYGKKDIS